MEQDIFRFNLLFYFESETMSKELPLRIGIITIQNAPWNELVDRWKFIDNTDFDSLWVADHFTHWKEKEMIFFECWQL